MNHTIYNIVSGDLKKIVKKKTRKREKKTDSSAGFYFLKRGGKYPSGAELRCQTGNPNSVFMLKTFLPHCFHEKVDVNTITYFDH